MWVTLQAFSLILSHLLIGISLVDASPICLKTGNFTDGTYGENRDLVLASLLPNVSANGGFFTSTTGRNSDKVYGLGMCIQGDTPDGCYRCLNFTIQQLISNCPNQKEALSWGTDLLCLVRYSNSSFYNILQLEPSEGGYNIGNVSWNMEFNTIWESLMDSVVTKASNASSSPKYATGEAKYSAFETIYALMQCTPDLSHNDCDSCLRETVRGYRSCCFGKRGGYVRNPNCYFRWDLYRFYESNASTTAPSLSPPPSPPPPPPPPPPQSVNTTITKDGGGSSSRTVIIVLVPIVIFVALLVILAVSILTKKIKKRKQDDQSILTKKIKKRKQDDQNNKNHEESLQFEFDAVRVATENFSDANLLGRGGFGLVYKGKLEDGRKVAIKRLSQNSGQGENEFKNEVMLLAKLQHRNLVRLFGFCLQQKERILIYEFLPNSSLDNLIFDPVKRLLLNWEKRYKIIEGIAKGLVYLHQDSQYRIIHRDLKAANILLDEEMKPKIADFGMAKLFGVDQTRADTSKIAGTFGYMAPEYAWQGQYSVKSDVYSFGVLVLEIISGQKINSFSSQGAGDSLITHAWRKWNERTALEVVDAILRDDGSRSEIMRCIHLGLLCVQENMDYRPSMASVVLMLSSYSMSLPVPTRPAFSRLTAVDEESISKSSYSSLSDRSKTETVQVSVNEASISELDPR